MLKPYNFKGKSFAIYGLGLTGKSVVNFLKKNKVNKIFIWDDNLYKHNHKLKKNYDSAISFDPNHLSFYHLTIEPQTRFFKSKPEIPSDDDAYILLSSQIVPTTW